MSEGGTIVNMSINSLRMVRALRTTHAYDAIKFGRDYAVDGI